MSPETTRSARAESADPERTVESAIEDARAAMAAIEEYDQAQVDELARAVGWAVYEADRCRELSELAVETTGLGVVEDKYRKKRRKITGALAEMLGEPTVGVVERDPENELVEIAKPVGVVGAVVPSTNPGATPTLLSMMAVKSRNAILLSPSPRGRATCEQVVEWVR